LKPQGFLKTWRDTVEDMMAESRTRMKLTNVFPDENGSSLS
jgi:hypothetical protein